MNPSQSIFQNLPDIKTLPLILAGPILRRTESNKVSVWLALKESRSLSLEIYQTSNQGLTVGKLLFNGQRSTIQLGKNLHVVVISAIPKENELLEPGKIYAYNIYCESDRYSLIDDFKISGYSLSYFPHQLPTFVLPANNLDRLKIVHGSCRKPHGGGKDTLSCLDNLIEESAHLPTERPQQLFLTGDQIYGDDVADPILYLIQGVNRLLFGWSEELPLIAERISADDLIPGQRTEIARTEGGLTAMLKSSPEEAKSHLFSFGEYAAAYLLAWSTVLMPVHFPRGKSLFKNRKQSRHWDKEVKEIDSFINDLDKVQRAFANIPVYTICDDHDISDDWYLNREWCDRVLGKPLGKRIVGNGLLAYALFQAWGNTPEYFEAETSGAKLLEVTSQWLTSQGKDLSAKVECDRYLGIPPNSQETGLPQFESDNNVIILARDIRAIPWHYTISSSRHEVIVLDTRTWRGYEQRKDRGIEPPMLLCPKAFEQQLAIPLSKSNSEIEATIIVLPTNLVALGIIDRIQQFEFSRDRVFNSDVGDSWNFHQEAFAKLLLTIFQQRQRVIILSGDIHYSCAVRLDSWFHDSGQNSVLVQLTSSAIKNSEIATRLIHTKIKSLLPEKAKGWLVWNQPFKVEKLEKLDRSSKQNRLPDWQYRTEWSKRQPAESLPWEQYSSKSNCKPNFWQKLIGGFLSWLWRNQWLQEGSEVVGRNNISLVKFQWLPVKKVIQETYWHPPWSDRGTVKSRYEISLETKPLPPSKSQSSSKLTAK